jgi:hypothetical protein
MWIGLGHHNRIVFFAHVRRLGIGIGRQGTIDRRSADLQRFRDLRRSPRPSAFTHPDRSLGVGYGPSKAASRTLTPRSPPGFGVRSCLQPREQASHLSRLPYPLPPAVRTPRRFDSSAIPLKVDCPRVSVSLMVGARSTANGRACDAPTSEPALWLRRDRFDCSNP